MARKTHIGTDNAIDLRLRRRRTHSGGAAGDRLPRLTVVRPVAKTALTPGTVVWAHIPYEETDGYKLRPSVVTHVAGREVTVLPGTTSHTRHRHSWAYREVADLDAAGLRRATGIHLDPITVDLMDIVHVAGVLGPQDHLAVVEHIGDSLPVALAAAA